jgi:hypothetical protein
MNTQSHQSNDDEVMSISVGAGQSEPNGTNSEAWIYENWNKHESE